MWRVRCDVGQNEGLGCEKVDGPENWAQGRETKAYAASIKPV
jgi:hypothetical protein